MYIHYKYTGNIKIFLLLSKIKYRYASHFSTYIKLKFKNRYQFITVLIIYSFF